MQKTLLDTDTFSEILKGKNPAVQRNAAAYRTAFGFYTLSVVTVMEMVASLARRELRRPLSPETEYTTPAAIWRADRSIKSARLSHLSKFQFGRYISI
jgi:predicted nucleic acid-binding protein